MCFLFVAVDQCAVVVVLVGEAAQRVIARGVIPAAAGKRARSVLFAGALRAAIKVNPPDGCPRIAKLLRDPELVETMRRSRIMKLPDDGGHLVIRSTLRRNQ